MILNLTSNSMGSKIIDAAFNVDYEYRKAKKSTIINDNIYCNGT